jgi:activator of HSP90 ATPase
MPTKLRKSIIFWKIRKIFHQNNKKNVKTIAEEIKLSGGQYEGNPCGGS